MQNLTHRLYLINSTEPRLHLLSHTTPSHLTARFSAGASLLIKHNPVQFAIFKNPNCHSSSPVTSRLRELHYFLKVMDSDALNRLESDAASPNSNDEDSDQSVVSVNENRGVEDASSPNGIVDGEERKVLPEKLWKSVMKLNCETSAEGGNCDVYLVGTAHVSLESCHEVQAVINFLKPQVVFLELCASRIAILTPQNLKVPTAGEMIEQWKKKKNNAFGILYSWFLAKVASKLEVFPGSEFRVAYEEAMKYGGKVILGDRPVNITLRRTWGKMPLWHKTKFLYSLVFQAFFLPSPEHLNQMLKDMDDVDMLTLVIQEMSKEFPTVMETLVHERDKYMSSKLLKVASEHSSVVAVVGKGHLQGIKTHWKQPVELDKLLEMPSKKPVVSAVKILKTLGITFAGVAIISCIYHSCRK